jgi:hypothetical protein
VQEAQKDRTWSHPRRSEGRPARARDDAAGGQRARCDRARDNSLPDDPAGRHDANGDYTDDDYFDDHCACATWERVHRGRRSTVGHTHHSCMGHSTWAGTDIRATP